MRRSLCAMLFSCFFSFAAVNALTADDLTTAQTQQLVSAAQSTKPGAKPSEATLLIDGKNVVFAVIRDAVGNVIARPIPGPDSVGVTISQVSIQMRADKNGMMLPASLVMVLSNQTILSYSVQINLDGTIAKLHQVGTVTSGAGGSIAAKSVQGGIGGNDDVKLTTSSATTKEPVTAQKTDRYPGFTSGQLSLPAGAGTGEVSHSTP